MVSQRYSGVLVPKNAPPSPPPPRTSRKRSVASSCASCQPPSAQSNGSTARCRSSSQASSKASPIHDCPPACKTRSTGGSCAELDTPRQETAVTRSRRTRQSEGSPGARVAGRSPLRAIICNRGSKHALGVRNLYQTGDRFGDPQGCCAVSKFLAVLRVCFVGVHQRIKFVFVFQRLALQWGTRLVRLRVLALP